MNKLHQLKSEYTISQAAKRLSISFEEAVDEADIYELCIEGNLQIYWRVTQVEAVKVLYSTRLVDWFGGGSADPSRSNFLAECDERDVGDTPVHRGFLEEFSPCGDFVSTLSGTFSIELQLSELESWVLGQARNHNSYDIGKKPVILSDSKGQLWQTMSRINDDPVDDALQIDDSCLPESFHNCVQYYVPNLTRPKPSELVILRTDIEVLEQKINSQANSPTGDSTKLPARLEASYKRIIGAMLELLLDERGFSSQSALIDKMRQKHSNKEGISKSKLETVFAEAKRALNN